MGAVGIELFRGDCLEVMKEIPEGSIDMVCTDPPYQITECKWDTWIPLEPLWMELRRIVKPGGVIVMTASQPFTTTLISSNLAMFKYCLVWDKVSAGSPGLAKYRPMPCHEDIVIFGRGRLTYNPQMGTGKPYKDKRQSTQKIHADSEHGYRFKGRIPTDNTGTRYPKSIIQFAKSNRKGQHPTQKPVPLMEYLIKTYTNEGETVLDFAMGSGTTGIAAQNLDRNFLGIELDDKYFEMAKARISANKEGTH